MVEVVKGTTTGLAEGSFSVLAGRYWIWPSPPERPAHSPLHEPETVAHTGEPRFEVAPTAVQARRHPTHGGCGRGRCCGGGGGHGQRWGRGSVNDDGR